MNKSMFGIGTIAMVAAILMAASTTSTDDAFAKKKYGQSDAQTSASANECGRNNAENGGVFTSATNCLNDPDQILNSDGAATVSSNSQQSEANN